MRDYTSLFRFLCAPLIVLLLSFSLVAASMAPDPVKQVKDYLNNKVEAVRDAEPPAEKRAIMNATLDSFITATSKSMEDDSTPEEAIASLEYLRNHFEEKKEELNGTANFVPVADDQLNSFASFIQQDTETALINITGDEVTDFFIEIALLGLLIYLIADWLNSQ